MKGRQTLITLLALAAIASTSFLAYRYENRPNPHLCAVCDRPLHAGVSYELEVKGHTEYVCCPRCGMHYALEHSGAVSRASATDLLSGQMIPAESAYYVEGGDVEYCTRHENPVQREPQGASVRAYDRCLPTLVAFKTQEEAEAYRAQHGGRVLDYAQALESVKER